MRSTNMENTLISNKSGDRSHHVGMDACLKEKRNQFEPIKWVIRSIAYYRTSAKNDSQDLVNLFLGGTFDNAGG